MTDRLSGRDVLWRLLDGIGLEHCRLTSDPDGHVLAGIVVTTEDGSPVTVEYSVRCDRFWHTRDVSVSVAKGGSLEVRTLRLTSDGDGSWWSVAADSENMPIRQVSGCIDVDLAFTPATNTLPLRRHDMAVGGKVVVAAAWVQFPSLELAMLNQRYTRLADRSLSVRRTGAQFRRPARGRRARPDQDVRRTLGTSRGIGCDSANLGGIER